MAAATIAAYLAAATPASAAVAWRLRELIDETVPGTPSRMYQGIPVWFFGEKPSIGVKANTADVALLFFAGQRIDDPTGLLSPSGSFELASVKLRTPDDIDASVVRDWIERARAVEVPLPERN